MNIFLKSLLSKILDFGVCTKMNEFFLNFKICRMINNGDFMLKLCIVKLKFKDIIWVSKFIGLYLSDLSE